jgi:hypothetical protein
VIFPSGMDNGDEANTLTQCTKNVRIKAVEILNLLSKECVDAGDCLDNSNDFLADKFLGLSELTTGYKNLAHLYSLAVESV